MKHTFLALETLFGFHIPPVKHNLDRVRLMIYQQQGFFKIKHFQILSESSQGSLVIHFITRRPCKLRNMRGKIINYWKLLPQLTSSRQLQFLVIKVSVLPYHSPLWLPNDDRDYTGALGQKFYFHKIAAAADVINFMQYKLHQKDFS